MNNYNGKMLTLKNNKEYIVLNHLMFKNDNYVVAIDFDNKDDIYKNKIVVLKLKQKESEIVKDKKILNILCRYMNIKGDN